MPILPVRSTLGGDIATKVHVGDAHANTTPRHRRTAMGAILLLIRLSRTGRHRVRKKENITNRIKQIHIHTHNDQWLGHTKNKWSQFHLTFSSFSAPPLLESFVLYCPSWFPGVKSEAKPWSLSPLGTGNYLHGMGWWALPETHQNWWTPRYSFTSFAGLLS